MRIKPFYSFLRGMALEDLWHDNSECPLGQSIAKADRIPGKDDIRKHCPYCIRLNEPMVELKIKN